MNSPPRNDEARGGGPDREAEDRNGAEKCSTSRWQVHPEYLNSRRAFIVAMFAIGAVKRERLVERIVAELEAETT